MNHFVPRTCTEIGEDGAPIKAAGPSDDSIDRFRLLSGDDSPAESEGSSRSLEHYRENDAYILLGAPGAGKTAAFKREAKRGGGHYVTARYFTRYDRPEWRDTTLFIDGLDEMRAGAEDGRTPLDSICAKLDLIGRPWFRLSCREADWFGANDREHLKSISIKGEIKVLRLDSLSGDGVREILAHQGGIDDTDGFIATVRERGIDGLLVNPQSLLMLAQAVTGGSWPETRMQTFELACKRLVLEHNPEHQMANSNQDLSESELLDAAGRLCAVQLLTGSAGYVLLGDGEDSEYLGLQRISGGNQATFRHVLGTKLFESPGENRVAPTHRQIAEFLAGRHLSQRIEDGLPVGRVLALMAGDDGGIVSELRGLSAWLAAHVKTNRGEIIDRDPFGTVFYGDVRAFSHEEKYRVLKYMYRETMKNPWLSSMHRIDSRLGDLANPDMKEIFQEILSDPGRDDARQQFTFFVLQSLVHGQGVGALSDLLMRTVKDDSWSLLVRCQALDTLLIRYQNQDMGTEDLWALLAEIHAGSVSDPYGELLGTLLRELYPRELPASDLLKYLKMPKNSSLHGRYKSFWTRYLPENSNNMQLARILDAITKHFGQLRPALRDLDEVATALLLCYLKTSEDVTSPEKLFSWLMIISDLENPKSPEIRSWLTSHPDIQKKMTAIGVARCIQSSDFFHCIQNTNDRLFTGVKRPPDFGYWCLEQAISAANPIVKRYFIHQVADSVYDRSYNEHLSREIIEKCVISNHTLSNIFKERVKIRKDNNEEQQHLQENRRSLCLQKWRGMTILHEVALRENRCEPGILHQLAMVYFGGFSGIEGNTPRERFRDILDDDETLVGAVLDGLRGSVDRTEEVPHVEEVLRLGKEGRLHPMAFPFLAGLEEIGGPSDERRMRQALASYYMWSATGFMKQPPIWYESALKDHADVAADVLIQTIQAESGSSSQGISGVDRLRDNDDVARRAAKPLLEAFPTCCSTEQLRALGILLGAALRFCDAVEILKLTDRKIASRSMNTGQRVYWLVTGLFASEYLNSAESYRERLKEYVSSKEHRIRYLTEFVDRIGDWIYPERIGSLGTPALRLLIELMGSSYKPAKFDSRILDSKSHLILKLINKLASVPSPEASEHLESLAGDDTLHSWKSHLVDAAYRQNALRREANFHHPDIDRVLETIDGGRPANAADLAALTFDFLTELARNIRDGNTSDWRQYWNWDRNSHRQPLKPMHEDDCRDRLLSDLRIRVGRLDIDAAPEGRYAEEKRSDIRVSYGGFNVPVEIKKSKHRNLWSAIRNQLIAKYTRDPGADGHGIYVVFWFGREHCQPPESGLRPSNAAELEERLRDTLSPEEARKIRICVIDVAEPQA